MADPFDITLPDTNKEYEHEIHAKFIKDFANQKSSYESCMVEYLRMSGLYWGLTTLELLNHPDVFSKEEIMKFVFDCIDDSGGISAAIGHDPHLLYTLSGVQIACILNCEQDLPIEKIVNYVKSLQQPDGSFAGDIWGEIDSRFSFCAVACLSLLGRMDAIDIKKSVEYVMSCYNFDGGFGSRPNSESHAGLIYCCVGFLTITDNIGLINADLLGNWLSERQLSCGGLNGRPGKLPDVCYSWWVLASLFMIGRSDWIDDNSLKNFIFACQDTDVGGISDRPGDMSDPFHTLFGTAALSLIKHSSIKAVDPCYCMPKEVIDRLFLRSRKEPRTAMSIENLCPSEIITK